MDAGANRRTVTLGGLVAMGAISAAIAAGAAACTKDDAKSDRAPVAPTDVPTFQITGTPQPAAAAPPSASAGVTGGASAKVAAGASAGSTQAASAVASGSAKSPASGGAKATAPANAAPDAGAGAGAATAAGALKPAAAHLTGNHYALDVASPGCKAGDACVVTLRLNVGGEYHVNKEYPYKFVAKADPAIDFLGTGDANTFSRAKGDFKEEGEKTATMTVRFKAKSAGPANVSGTFRMSVCSAANCQLERQPVSLTVDVM
jgi:hypothetical protein